MPDSIGVALIGTSGIAFEHGRAWQRCPDAKLVAVWGSHPERAQALAQRLGVRSTTRYQELLDDPAVQVVDIVTEPRRHVELALPPLQHGKHLLIEKPLDEDLEAASRLVTTAKDLPLRCSVIAPKRFDPAILAIRKRLADGAIGAPVMARAAMLLHRDLAYYQQPPGWRGSYGSVLLNQAIHWLDVLVWLFGVPESVQAVTARQRREIACSDTAAVCAAHPNGVVSCLHATTACRRNYPETFEIDGDAGRLDYRAIARRQRFGRWVRFGPRSARPSLLDRQVADFAGSLKTGAPPAVSLEDGYEALRLVKRCEAAAAAASTEDDTMARAAPAPVRTILSGRRP